MIKAANKGKRYSPIFQFQVVLEVLNGDRESTEIARVYNIHPVTVSRWKQEFLEKGGEVFGKDTTVAQYEKNGVGKTRPSQKNAARFIRQALCHNRNHLLVILAA